MIGVIIGRFQVDEIHAGHLQLLDYVTQHHDQVLILLGCRHSPATRAYPLEFRLRQQMLEQVVPDALVLPVFDQPSDESWSKQVDALIDGVFPNRQATLYGGRDSFIPHYHGHHPTRALDFGSGDSGTNIREAIARRPRHTPDFRAGVIYALETLTPRIFLTVDIALFKGSQVLLGRKGTGGLWRLPGGFVDLKDENLEAAARRELREETGMVVEGPMRYRGSFTVDDWRTREVSDAKHLTALFSAEHSWGAPQTADDLAEIGWFDLGHEVPIVPEHRPLLRAVQLVGGTGYIQT